MQYKKEVLSHNSSYRVDYQQNGYQKPDSTIRRNGWLGNDGMEPKFLLHHHGNRYMANQITWYDEDYNRRPRTGAENYLPPLRQFSTHVMAWIPEKSDHPLRGQPTSWGLVNSKQKAWSAHLEDKNLARTPMSNYQNSFVRYSSDVLNDARRKKYDTAALNASQVVPAGKPLDAVAVASARKF